MEVVPHRSKMALLTIQKKKKLLIIFKNSKKKFFDWQFIVRVIMTDDEDTEIKHT